MSHGKNHPSFYSKHSNNINQLIRQLPQKLRPVRSLPKTKDIMLYQALSVCLLAISPDLHEILTDTPLA